MIIGDKDFIGHSWLQNCGQECFVVCKTNKKSGHAYLYLIRFYNPFYECYAQKINVLNGMMRNKRYDIEKIVGHSYKQHCGDILKVLGYKYTKEKGLVYKCRFTKFPKTMYTTSTHIKNRDVLNFKYDEIIGKIFKSYKNGYFKVIRKTYKKNIANQALFEIKFLGKYPFTTYKTKYSILKGEVLNKNHPLYSKQQFIKFLNNYKNQLTFQEIALKLERDISRIRQLVEKWNLKSLINIEASKEETSLRNFIKENYKGIITTFEGKKEDNFYEIDIYLPELRIGFEYNGSYWHKRHEQKYPKYHEQKFKYFLSKGILIFNIWDYFWFKDKSHIFIREEAKTFIKEILKQFSILKLENKIIKEKI